MKKIKIILFDFDGVILNSNKVRECGFRKIFEDFDENKVNKLIEFHRKNGGLSRFVKIDFFFKKILKSDLKKRSLTSMQENIPL